MFHGDALKANVHSESIRRINIKKKEIGGNFNFNLVCGEI